MPRMLALAVFVLAVAPAAGQDAGPGGKDVYEVACARCHSITRPGTPKIGDRAAWAKRAAQGIESLTRHALEGIRSMPAHGDESTLNLLEIQRATVYMVNESGGHWVEPRGDSDATRERSGAEVVQTQCAVCHQAGFAGAPRTGDHAAWMPFLSLGMDAAVRKVVRGHGDMPPRGGRASLTDAEIRAAVIIMASRPRR